MEINLKTATKRLSATAAMLIALGSVSAASADSGSGGAFLGITPSARAYSLGMATGITALGPEAIGANPANLGLMTQRFEVFTAYANLLDGTHYEHIAAAFTPKTAPLGIDGVGLAVTHLQSANFQGADAAGNKTVSTFNAGDMAASLSISSRLRSSLRLGATAKVVQSRIAGYTSNPAIAADLGMTYTITSFSKPISMGFSVTNISGGIRFLDQTDKLPTSANLGIALPLGPTLAVFEVNRQIYEQQTQASLGLEYTLGVVSFRGGYLAQRQAGKLALADQKGGSLLGGLSAGVGIKMGAARLDYAMSQQAADYGTTQRVALSLCWGSARQKIPREEWLRNVNRSDWLIWY